MPPRCLLSPGRMLDCRIARVRIFGLDFTSAPSRQKPLVAVGCAFDGRDLRVERAEALGGFDQFEAFLESDGPWVCGMDFPFGQPRSLVEALGWPANWEGYVGKVSRLSKAEFEEAIRADMATRPAGAKYRYRLADRRSHSSSAMMLFRVPVGKMFYQGAPRLFQSRVSEALGGTEVDLPVLTLRLLGSGLQRERRHNGRRDDQRRLPALREGLRCARLRCPRTGARQPRCPLSDEHAVETWEHPGPCPRRTGGVMERGSPGAEVD